MKWVTPLLMVGTKQDAQHLPGSFVFAPTSGEAISCVSADQACVVPTKEIAADVIRHFGASEEWVESHVMRDWQIPSLDHP
jgi:hypothetical protein